MMAAGDEPTMGEVWRRLDALERRIDNGFSRLDHSIESMQFVHQTLYETNQKAIWEAIRELKGKNTWIARTVAGALITAAVTAFIALLAVRGGP